MSVGMRYGRRMVALRVAMGIVLVLPGACRPVPADEGDQPPRVRVALTAAPEIGDVPAIVALEHLSGRGHVVQVVPFAQAELAAEALARGDVELALGGVSTYWTAAARGAPIVTVMEQYRTAHLLAATQSIRTCVDLAGRPLGVNSLGATGGLMVRRYLEEACPDIRPNVLIMPGHVNRLAALRSGAIDAATILRVDAVELMRDLPGRFAVVEDFGERWPDLVSAGVHTTRRFAATHPDVVAEYVRACLTAHRTLGSDAARLASAAGDVLEPGADYGAVAAEYVRVEAFSPDGGLTPARIAETLGFLEWAGQVSRPVDSTTVVDRTFLEQAIVQLDEEPFPFVPESGRPD